MVSQCYKCEHHQYVPMDYSGRCKKGHCFCSKCNRPLYQDGNCEDFELNKLFKD